MFDEPKMRLMNPAGKYFAGYRKVIRVVRIEPVWVDAPEDAIVYRRLGNIERVKRQLGEDVKLIREG